MRIFGHFLNLMMTQMMSLTDYLITGSAVLISFLIGISSYFIAKWIGGVDATLEKHSDNFYKLSLKVGSLESKQDAAAADITKAVQAQLSTVKFPYGKVDKIEQEISLIKSSMQEKVLPHIERQSALVGRVTVVENRVNQFISGLEKLKAAKPPQQK